MAAWIIGVRELPPVKITDDTSSYKIFSSEWAEQEKGYTYHGQTRIIQCVVNRRRKPSL